MANLNVIIVALFATIPLILAGALPKDDKPSAVVVHVTNRTSVPSAHYLIDAVQLLKEAISIYPDDASIAKLYSELYHEKHPEYDWNVAVGYTAAILSCDWYVECSVKGTKSLKLKSDKDKGKDVKYLIFSGKETNNATLVD